MCRLFGAARFDIYGAVRGFCLRHYRGSFAYLPVEADARAGRKWTADAASPLPAGLAATGSASGAGAGGTGLSPAVVTTPAVPAATPAATPTAATEGASGTYGPSTPLPPIRHLSPFDHPTPLTWRSITGAFVSRGEGRRGGGAGSCAVPALAVIAASPPPLMRSVGAGPFSWLWVTNTTHQSIGVAGAPGTSHDDGVLTVSIMRDASCTSMVPVLLSLDDAGSHAAHPAVETFQCLAFRLEPHFDPAVSRQGEARTVAEWGGGEGGGVACQLRCPMVRAGHLSLDGEDVDYGIIQAEVHPSLLRVYGPAVAAPVAEGASDAIAVSTIDLGPEVAPSATGDRPAAESDVTPLVPGVPASASGAVGDAVDSGLVESPAA
jgi:hypothetical protein